MKIKILRCHTCGALGVGPNKIKLWPLDDLLYCEQGSVKHPGCFRSALTWHESRTQVVRGIETEHNFYHTKPIKKILPKKRDWRSMIRELSDLAGWGLEVGDKRTFVHYASRAVLAWGLKETQEIEDAEM